MYVTREDLYAHQCLNYVSEMNPQKSVCASMIVSVCVYAVYMRVCMCFCKCTDVTVNTLAYLHMSHEHAYA